MIIMFFFGKYMTWLFIDKSQTDVINVSVTYFHTVFWAYPFLGSIFLYRNGLQGLGYGLVPMLGGVFELAARSAIVMFVAGKTSFAGVCLADPAAWIAALIPLAVSGGIHLDGLCDTCDALCSFGDREKRLDILKDPHVGAFGPLWLMAFLLAEVGCFAQIYDRPVLLPLACTGFAFARTMGGRKVVASPCAKDSGLAHIFAENSDKRAVSRMLLAEFVLFAVLLGLWIYRVPHALAAAKVLVIVLVVWYAVHEHISRRVFGGVTGDLAGFCISLSELITLAAAAIGGLIL